MKNDGFPSWICHNCLSLVDKCYEFFDQCRTNQAALNESYIAALSEAGVSVVPLKVIKRRDYFSVQCQIYKESKLFHYSYMSAFILG